MHNLHLGITAFCALVSVALAAVQTFRSGSEAVAPKVEVQVVAPSAESAPATSMAETVNSDAKSDAAVSASFQSPAPLEGASFAPGTRPDTLNRYRLSDLFDGNATTLLTLSPPDMDVDFIVSFPMAQGTRVTGIEISAPEGIPVSAYPASLEVMVLPDGTMEGSGREVASFALQPASPVQSFALKPSIGRAIWLRIAGQPLSPATIIGDIRILTGVGD